jgi:hypothetical protein
MAHFAEIDSNNVVTRVLVVSDADATDGQNFLANTLGLGGTWKQTSYNTSGGVHLNGGTPYRFNYAGIGYTFDESKGTDGAFIAPKPYASWVLNEETCLWNAPTPMPVVEGKRYAWVEEDLNWQEIVLEETEPE